MGWVIRDEVDPADPGYGDWEWESEGELSLVADDDEVDGLLD